MAKGDVVFFDQFLVDGWEGEHNLELDTIKVGFIDSVQTPVATATDPRWGAGGTTNYATNEVTPGGNYAAGGPSAANPTVTLSAGKAVFDADDISILQNASNPTDTRWGIIYNDTNAGKRAIGYVDWGAVTDMTAGPFDLTWNANGIAELDQV